MELVRTHKGGVGGDALQRRHGSAGQLVTKRSTSFVTTHPVTHSAAAHRPAPLTVGENASTSTGRLLMRLAFLEPKTSPFNNSAQDKLSPIDLQRPFKIKSPKIAMGRNSALIP